ncbi:MAG: hypothetical protein GY761_19465 [Hyphomicrobiales bacterium]|nr:hypothetical protein [Hyphomicrobiales bacterium]
MTRWLQTAKLWVLTANMLMALAVPLALAQSDDSAQDMALWSAIMDSNNPTLFESYLLKFPNGAFSLIARDKLKSLAAKSPGKSNQNNLPSRPEGAQLRKRAKENYPVDLDGNGTIEEVLLVPSGRTELGNYYSLAVLDENAGIIWAGPSELNENNPLVFGEWHFGISMPEIISDIDLDGAVELVAPAPQSDVSPTFFRVLRWNNNAFSWVRNSMLLETPPGSGIFPWSTGEQYEGTWVSGFQAVRKPGEITVNITDYRGGVETKTRLALLWPDANGYVLHSWLDNKSAGDDVGAPTSGQQNNSNDSVEQLLQQADQIMGDAYRQSDEVQRNSQMAKALDIYRIAAKKGSARAHYNIGFLYETGNGVKGNNETAIQYYEKAATMGYMDAFTQIILVQNQLRLYGDAAKSFFKFYKANSALALEGFENLSYSPDVLRAIQRKLKASGHYRGSIDGDIGPGTRAAIAAHVAESP